MTSGLCHNSIGMSDNGRGMQGRDLLLPNMATDE